MIRFFSLVSRNKNIELVPISGKGPHMACDPGFNGTLVLTAIFDETSLDERLSLAASLCPYSMVVRSAYTHAPIHCFTSRIADNDAMCNPYLDICKLSRFAGKP